MQDATVAVLGAGKVGTVLARLAVQAGYRTLIAGSGSPDKIALIVDVVAPGAEPLDAADAVDQADLVVLALPLANLASVPNAALSGKVVVDAMNYWPFADGVIELYETTPLTSSELVRDALGVPGLVKSFNHMGYHELERWSRPPGDPERKALGVAGDDESAMAAAAELVDALGFDPVPLTPLSAGRALQPGGPAFGADLDRDALEEALSSERLVED